MIEYLANRRTNNRKRAKDYFGNVCNKCNSTEELEFDHIDPLSVSFRIGTMYSSSWANIEKELQKCQLLCHSCHWKKTRVDRKLKPAIHGTTNMYINKKCRCNLCKKAWTVYFAPKHKAIRHNR